MIHVFFVPGMFGTTVEYVLRSFTNEMTAIHAEILNDGSMHSFKKQNHPLSVSMLDQQNLKEINTPIYPFEECHLPEILQKYTIDKDDRCILIYAKTFNDAEKNLLFAYHKISCGLGLGKRIFYSNNASHDVSAWNPTYSNYSDLTPWEFREWFSIFYPTWINEWQQSYFQVPNSWLKISCGEILSQPQKSFEDIISFCNMTKKTTLTEFVAIWQQAQQYIVAEYELLHHIVDSTLAQHHITWNPLNYIGEAIVQKKLRDCGYEIRCDGLNVFPCDSQTLYNLLEKC